jgi:hypothetical protein
VNVKIERGFPNSLLGRMERIEEEDFLRKVNESGRGPIAAGADTGTGTFKEISGFPSSGNLL